MLPSLVVFQKIQKFQIILKYIVNLRLAWATWDRMTAKETEDNIYELELAQASQLWDWLLSINTFKS